MTKEEFRRLAQSGLLFLDGATGSNLQKQGMPVGVCPELWITEHEEIMSGLQKAYLEAGTNILYAPTFTANRIKLKEFDLEDRIEELNHKLVEISKRAADGKALVAGDLTMTGQQLKPMGPLDFEELIDVYKEQIRYITEAGADLLVVETMMSLQESRAALIAAKETCPDIPVMVTMTFESDGRSLFGTDAATAAQAGGEAVMRGQSAAESLNAATKATDRTSAAEAEKEQSVKSGESERKAETATQAVNSTEKPAAKSGTKSAAAAEKNSSRSGYAIQIMASDKRISSDDRQFGAYRGKVECYEGAGALKYKYCYGEFSTRAEAQRNLAAVRRTFRDAFVVRYENGRIAK